MLAKGKIPFVRLLIPLTAGILAAKLYPLRLVADHGVIIMAGLFPVICICALFYKHLSFYKRSWIPGTLIHVAVFCLGYQLAIHKSGRFDPHYFSLFKGSGLVVSVQNEPRRSNDILRFEGEVEYVLNYKQATPATGKLLVAVKLDSSGAGIKYGDLLLVASPVTEIEPPYNPGEFDYKAFLANRQIYYQAFTSQSEIVVLSGNAGNPIIGYALALRERLVNRFNQYIKDADAAAVVATLILGYRADLKKDVLDAYSKTGTLHVLSVSGMHVALVFWVLNIMLKAFDGHKRLRFLKPTVAIPLIWFYALITGFSPSVCRAALMLTFYILGKALNRSHNSYNLIAISAFFLLLYNPYYLFDVGFQLSYLAVLGLIYLYPRIYHQVYFKKWLLDKGWSYAALSIAAQLATFPLSVYYFHQFPVYFLISNLFIVLPVTLIMYLGFVFLLIPVDVLSGILGPILSQSITWVNNGLLFIETMPLSTFDDLWINAFEHILIYGIIGMLIWAVEYRNKQLLFGSLMTILLLLCSFSWRSIKTHNQHQLIFFSLRKNTAIGYLNGKKGCVITNLRQEDKVISFSVKPAFSSRGVAVPDFYRDSTSVNPFLKFGNYSVLIWDRTLDFKSFRYPVSVDAVILTSNARVSVSELMERLSFKTLMFDSSNSDSRISNWQSEAIRLDVKYHILKRNPAYIVEL